MRGKSVRAKGGRTDGDVTVRTNTMDYYFLSKKPIETETGQANASPEKLPRLDSKVTHISTKEVSTDGKQTETNISNTLENTSGNSDSLYRKPKRRSISANGIKTLSNSQVGKETGPVKKNVRRQGKVVSNSPSLENLCVVRRSERRCLKDLLAHRELSIVQKIINKDESDLIIQHFPGKGRGIVAGRRFFKDDFIVEYAGDLLSDKESKEREEKYKQDPTVGCYMYHFEFRNKKYCVDATAESGRLGRLLNHSRLRPNCYTKVVPVNDVPHLTLFAKRDLVPGEELLYDYGDKCRDVLNSHPWLSTT